MIGSYSQLLVNIERSYFLKGNRELWYMLLRAYKIGIFYAWTCSPFFINRYRSIKTIISYTLVEINRTMFMIFISYVYVILVTAIYNVPFPHTKYNSLDIIQKVKPIPLSMFQNDSKINCYHIILRS